MTPIPADCWTSLPENHLPYKWIDLENDPDVEAFLRRMNVGPRDTPVVILGHGKMLRNPSNSGVSAELGMQASPGRAGQCEVLVVGAGPAGLAASVYGASDGLQVTMVDAIAAGGRASTTSRIENYLGFPAGISGAELTERAVVQVHRFGARVVVPARVTALVVDGDHFRVELGGLDAVRARGVRWWWPRVRAIGASMCPDWPVSRPPTCITKQRSTSARRAACSRWR